jgi:predicted acetylornithine/succinylornithine family transaminase
MTKDEIIRLEAKYITPTYKRLPIVLVRGEGEKVWDIDGKEYLDFVGGLGVANIGHCHRGVVEAIKHQAEQLLHTSNLYYTKPQVDLAKKLSELSFPSRVFFANSGAEANEAAIKLARKFGKKKGKFEIITFRGSFHGRTLATLTATGQKKYKIDFEPLLDGFKCVAFNNLEEVKKCISPTTSAIMVEVIQGEGGVNVAEQDFIFELRNLCDKEDILLIIDEVQTGVARTGKLFGYQHFGITPDVITLAKGLGGGVPIGAMIAREEMADCLERGSHASTFGGNPLVCAAGIATLDIILMEDLVSNAQKMGDYFMGKLKELKRKYHFIKDVRGKGLMIGVELSISGTEIVVECLRLGLLINCTVERVLRFLPPLGIKINEIEKAIEILDRVFRKVSNLI